MRYFIAVEVPAEVRNVIFKMQKQILDIEGIAPVKPENLHITLKFLGNQPQELMDSASKILSHKLSTQQQFHLGLNDVGYFPNENFMRVVWLGVNEGMKELTSLQSLVDDVFSKYKFPREKDYIPHLTIARVKHYSREPLEKMKQVISSSNFIFPQFLIEFVKLMESTLTPRGPVYSMKESFKLGEHK